MKITTDLGEEIKNQFTNEWQQYKEYNAYEDDDYQTIVEMYNSFKEEWPQHHEDYYDAIIEEVDSIDEVEYITDDLDYAKYQEAEIILGNFIDDLNLV